VAVFDGGAAAALMARDGRYEYISGCVWPRPKPFPVALAIFRHYPFESNKVRHDN
jgi:hypothetical protein